MFQLKRFLHSKDEKYFRKEDRHPYELFLQLKDFEHRTTKVRRTLNNGYLKMLLRTFLEEEF